MDLDRLKINDAPRSRGGGWKTALLCLLCIGLGFGASRLLERLQKNAVVKVKTIIVAPSTGSKTKTFRAGGWIEVASPAYPIFISSKISERIDVLGLKEGDWVEPAQLLVKLDQTARQKDLDVAEARLATAQRELEKLKAGYRSQEIEAAEARVAQSAENLRYAKAKYERLKNLSRTVMSEEQIDQALATFRAGEAQYAEDVANRNKMKAGYQTEDIKIAEAKLKEAQSQRDVAALELSFCTINAPENSPRLRVLRVHRRVGEWINADKPSTILELYSPSEMQVRADVTQPNIKYVKPADKVKVMIEAHPQREYTGTVLRIDPLAELAKNTLTVRVRIDNPDEMLFPEMVAQVAFSGNDPAEKSSPALLLPKQAVRQEQGSAFVFLSQNGLAQRQPITSDGEQGEMLKIASGLNPGQRVILSASGELQDGARVQEE